MVTSAWPRRDVIGQITHPFPDYLDNNMPLHDDQQTGHYLLMGSGRYRALVSTGSTGSWEPVKFEDNPLIHIDFKKQM